MKIKRMATVPFLYAFHAPPFPVIESPDGLVAIEPSTIIAEHNSDVTFTCRTNSGPIGAHTFMWNDTFESSKTQ